MPIFDQGYQHWSGALSGHAWRWLAITRHGLRVGLAGRWVRLLLILAWMPSIVLVAFLCVWGLLEQKAEAIQGIMPMLQFLNAAILTDPVAFRVEIWTIAYNYFLMVELWFTMVLVLLVGPNLISRDLRYNALPLYFSRPLRRIDYFAGKLGVIVALIGMVIIVPSVVAYVLGLAFSPWDATLVPETIGVLAAAVGYGLVIAFSAGLFVLALSALSRNSRYIALLWVGVWIISGITAWALETVDMEQRMRHRWNSNRRGADDFFTAEVESNKTDWRPLVSYQANLTRMREHFLAADEAWENVTRILPREARMPLIYANLGAQFPWYWSGAVLGGVMLFSLWILNRSIKSLDRLK